MIIIITIIQILQLQYTTGTTQNYTRTQCITYLQESGILPGFNHSTYHSSSIPSDVNGEPVSYSQSSSIKLQSLTKSHINTVSLNTEASVQPTNLKTSMTPTSLQPLSINITIQSGTTVSLSLSSFGESSMNPIEATEALPTTTPLSFAESLLSNMPSLEVSTISSAIEKISTPSVLPTLSATINQSLSSKNISIITSIRNATMSMNGQHSQESYSPIQVHLSSNLHVISSSSTPSTSTITMSTTSVMVSTPFKICSDLLFGTGNWSMNSTFPYQLLTEYGYTTTLPPTTTEPIPTTISAEEARRRLCESYEDKTANEWFSNCDSPCDPCTHHALNLTDEYFVCYKWMNNTHPSNVLAQEPMVLILLMSKFGEKLNKYKNDFACKNHPTYRKYDNFLMYAGKKYRYSDLRLPDYDANKFQYKQWHGRNDTIEIPYGNLPRGEYSFEFAIYEKIVENRIPKEKIRLKKEWSYKHPIITGAFIDPRVEPGLYYNDRLLINSVVISLDITPKRPSPLPGENIISFTHFNRKLINPVCVYWQPLDPGQEGELPTQGYWSNYGVRVFKTNISMTVCRSTHLSAFTLLMEPIPEQKVDEIDPLDALNVTLTLISVIMLIVYLLAMVMLKCYRNAYSRIYMMIAFSVLMAQLLFLGGFANRTSYDACTTIATFMQFCHVSAITWVMLESIHQLSRLYYFFNEKTNINAFYTILGLGLPIGVLVALQGFTYDKFESLKFCWVYIEGKDLWFFGGPLVLLTLVTLGLRFMTFVVLRKNPEKIETDINYERAFRSLIASIIVLPTFILLWLFGTFATRSSNKTVKDVSLIALPILNICLGAEILYLYFYRNDEVHDAILEEMSIREKQKITTYSHLRGLDMKVTYKESEENQDDESFQDYRNGASTV